MRITRVVAALALLPALALGQDADRPDPRGELLLAALPPRVDLVVHTPDLPRLLASATEAGLGASADWSDAFDAQLAAWGVLTDGSDALVAAGRELLAAADGEAVVAALSLPPMGGPKRATILAFRSSWDEARLAKAVQGGVENGLLAEYPGIPGREEIQGRTVIALAGAHDRLWVRVQDGLVAASDHPLALGLFFRGLERGGPTGAAGPKLLSVTYGSGSAAWTGWTYGEREAVSWTAETAEPLMAPLPAGLEPVAAVAVLRPRDLPLFPAPAPLWTEELPIVAGLPVLLALPRKGGMAVSGRVTEGAASPGIESVPEGQAALGSALWAVVRGADDVLGEGAAAATEPTLVAGAAGRHSWLRAWASGRLPAPVPSIPAERFLGPLRAADVAAREAAPVVTWDATETGGELRGPRWHGPATLLALRTIYDIATKSVPGAVAVRRGPRAPLPPKAGGSPLPDPAEPRDLPEEDR